MDKSEINQSDLNQSLDSGPTTLRDSVTQVMHHYFTKLAGEEPANVYDFVLEEVEEPLLVFLMQFTHDNQSEAAKILGLSRGTLRKKLKQYGML